MSHFGISFGAPNVLPCIHDEHMASTSRFLCYGRFVECYSCRFGKTVSSTLKELSVGHGGWLYMLRCAKKGKLSLNRHRRTVDGG